MRFLGVIPTFVTILASWSLYAVTVKGIFNTGSLLSPFMKLMVFLVVCASFSLMMIPYYLVIIRGPGSPSDYPHMILPENIEELDRNTVNPPMEIKQGSLMVKKDGSYRYCSKCKVWKPDRTHHCSSCDFCVLRMDHHCPWFGCCIGFKNHRLFIQFLVYASIYLFLVCAISSWILLQLLVFETLPTDKYFNLHILIVCFLAAVFYLSVSIFSIFTIYQVLVNRTTIESYEKQQYRNRKYHNPFDRGYRRNWESIMGETLWTAVNPFGFPNGNGLMFTSIDADLVFRLSGEFTV